MLTGETQDSLCEGMIVPVNIRVAKDDFIIAKLDSGDLLSRSGTL